MNLNVIFNKLKSPKYGIKLIYDDIEKAHLRSLGAIDFFGFNQYTFPKSWKIYETDIYNGQFILDRNLNSDNLPPHLICLTNQYYETYESMYSINKTIKLYLNNTYKNLILVVDTEKLWIKGKVRPLNEEPFINEIFSYDDLFKIIQKEYENNNFYFLLQDTKNLYFQDLSILIDKICNEEINRLEDLFNNIFKYPFLPIWNFFSSIFGQKGSNIPLQNEQFSKFLKFFIRRIETKESKLKKILKNFINELYPNNIDYLDENLRKNKLTNQIYNNASKFYKKILMIDQPLLKRRFFKFYKKDLKL
ncbi:MAG: hypothetical protein ACTSVV_08285 [Promethearchaeota archaeon]